jgi:hypothetical protein
MGRKRSAGLTPRQQEWLGHLQACARSGESVRAYAKRHGFSEHGMYQAAKGLRRRGALPTGRRRSRLEQKSTPAFVRVLPAASPIVTSTWRVRLPNGVVIEAGEALAPAWLEALARL